ANAQERAGSELDGLAVAPLAEHEVLALEGGVVPRAEAHGRALEPAGGRQSLHLLEAILHTGAREVHGPGQAFGDETADVIGGHADGSGGRARRARLEGPAPSVAVRHGVDVGPAFPAGPPVLADIAEHQRRV